MLQNFVILRAIPGGHNIMPHLGYPFSHPHSWEALDAFGNVCTLISRRSDYIPNIRIKINVRQMGTANAYIDNSPATLLNPGTAHSVVYPPAPSAVGEIDSDVILLVKDVKKPDALKTIVVGEIFYVDPRLKNLQDSTLRSAFQANAAIRVTTHLKPHDFNPGQTYIFENLRDVSVSNNIIHATDARMPKP